MSFAVRLNKRIRIQAPATGQDEYGEPLAGWVDVAQVWAEVMDLTGRQYVAAGATQNTVQTTVAIRYRAGIDAGMRVLHGADVYDIEAVLGQDRRELKLMCKRGTG